MAWLIVTGVGGCALVALWWVVRELRRVRLLLQGVEQGVPRGLSGVRLSERIVAQSRQLGVSEDVYSALERAGADASERERIAAHNLLTLEIQERLARGAGVSKLAWRIVAAATVAGVLLIGRDHPVLAAGLGGMGAVLAAAAFYIGRMADHTTRAARQRWNALIRALGGSFTNG
jgi:hypothetical protein